MSAFFVGAAHINVLLTWAKRVKLPELILAEELTAAGRIMLQENVRSLTTCYPASDWTGPQKEAESYEFKEVSARALHAKRAGLGDIINMTWCLDYQCCENEDYERSEGAAISRRIREAATRALIESGGRKLIWHWGD